MLFSLIELSARGSTLKARCLPPLFTLFPSSDSLSLSLSIHSHFSVPLVQIPLALLRFLSFSPSALNLAHFCPFAPAFRNGKPERTHRPLLGFAVSARFNGPCPIPARFILITRRILTKRSERGALVRFQQIVSIPIEMKQTFRRNDSYCR